MQLLILVFLSQFRIVFFIIYFYLYLVSLYYDIVNKVAHVNRQNEEKKQGNSF